MLILTVRLSDFGESAGLVACQNLSGGVLALVAENCHVQESRQTVVGWVLGMMVFVLHLRGGSGL